MYSVNCEQNVLSLLKYFQREKGGEALFLRREETNKGGLPKKGDRPPLHQARTQGGGEGGRPPPLPSIFAQNCALEKKKIHAEGAATAEDVATAKGAATGQYWPALKTK